MNPLLAGSALDLALGDPRWLPHPVRGFGWIATQLEEIFRHVPGSMRTAGVLFWIASVGTGTTIVRFTLPWASAYWVWMLLAIRDLDHEASLVVNARDLADARQKLSMIVGRDTAHLDEPGIYRAVIETVAENLTDGVIAPLFWYAIGGVTAMAALKCINTLDSIVGYRNERYREFGWCSARADDAANFIPARLTAALVWIASAILRFDARRSVAITLRDASLQPSPNSGFPEAAVAGAIGVRLGGISFYGGEISRKAFLGDPVRPPDREAFVRTKKILYTCAALMISAVLVIRHER